MNTKARRKLEMGARALDFSREHPDASPGYAAALARLEDRLNRAAQLEAQQRDGIWYIIPQFAGFLIYLLASTAEVSRIPFDLPEAEGELVAGYHTEYGGMRWAMFQNAEYIALISFSALASILFLGGYDGPLLPGPLWMLIKMFLFMFLSIWVRSTLPRVRYDRLMTIGWKVLLPLATVNLLVTSAVVAYRA